MDVLGRCGFEIQFLDVTFLPYSFSYYSYAQVHTDWTTLVVRAKKMTDRDAAMVITKSGRFDELQASRPDKSNPLRPSHLDLILTRPRSAENYQAMAAALVPEIGAFEFESAIGELVSRGLIDLRVEPLEPGPR
jgi:hypothetical protein